MPKPSDAPLYVAVVPVFKHSVLVVDAITSLLDQQEASNLRIIIVEDGCPHGETRDILTSLSLTHPETILYFRQANRGLSGARNTGIEIALAHYSEALGIYFLDADNRLEPWALTRVRDACRAHPEADWFFPDIVYFGLRHLWDGSGYYDGLEHLAHNYCEAGSFVRMRLFESGLRFDEAMKLGYEDWDFWLQALGRGYRGEYLPDSGFRYRKRGESMLSDSDRDREEILGYLRRKHHHTFSPRAILQHEARDRPRFCFIDPVQKSVCLNLGPLDPVARPEHRFNCSEFARQLSAYGWVNLGYQAFVATDDAWNGLAASGLLPWALREMELALEDDRFVALRMLSDEEPGTIRICRQPFAIPEAVVLATTPRVLSEISRNNGDDRPARLTAGAVDLDVTFLSIHLPTSCAKTIRIHPILTDFCSFLANLQSVVGSCADMQMLPHRSSHRLGFAEPLRVMEKWHGMHRPFPRLRADTAIDVGFVLPIGAFGGVERVAHQTATAVRARGHTPHLIIAGPSELRLPHEFADVYETVRFCSEGPTRPYRWNSDATFLGTPLPDHHSHHSTDLAGLCADLDVVVNCHSAPLNYAMSTLRRAGLLTCCSQHVFDVASTGHVVGHPLLSLAFEHAYDLMLPVSEMMAAQLHGLGIPRDKLLLIRNAGGIVIDPDQADAAMAARHRRHGPLRCIFLGRLDKQKGMDHLAALIEGCRNEHLPIEWRIVGKTVVDLHQTPSTFEGITVEPPVYDGSDIAADLAWADIVVMPSLYEGLPLLAFDAMAMGCVLVASNVGAIAELVSDMETGFLAPSDDVVATMMVTLRKLASDPLLRSDTAKRAVLRTRSMSWQQSVDPFIDWIEKRHSR